MTDEHDDLTRLLHGAVDDIEPRPGLQAIRSRTATKESPMSASRPWLLGALGGAVATAAVIGGVVLATNGEDRSGEEPDVVAPTTSEPASPSPSESAPEPSPTETGSPAAPESPRAADPASTTVLPVYYVGEVPGGLGLYREFQADGAAGDNKVLRATERAVELSPVDPDYRSAWPEGADVTAAEASADLITVDISGDLRNRPSGMTEREAALAVEQVVYTAQAALSQGRVPVQILLNGSRSDTVLGVPTSEPLANGPVLKTLAHASITTPFQGQVVSGDSIVVEGVANSFEANVLIELQPAGGGAAVEQTFATAEGYMGEKLFPFRTTLDVSGVGPGTYVLVVSTDDPSGGAEGNGPHRDTKTVEIR
jgi:hypothetical protein